MKTTFKTIAGVVVALLISTVSFAQKKAPLSPRDSTSGVVHGAHISINYVRRLCVAVKFLAAYCHLTKIGEPVLMKPPLLAPTKI